jgi:hypothetical protein
MPVHASKLIEEWAKLSPEEQQKQTEEIKYDIKCLGERYSQRYLSYMNIMYGSEEKAAIATIQKSDPTDFQAISGSKLTLSNSFYNNALSQSRLSFLWALIWAGVGALFFISTVTLVIVLRPTIATSVIIALLGGTGGIGSSAIAYATFQLYKQASEQAAACHIRLDRTSDFILANSACEGLDGPEKKQMRSEIIRKLFE